MGHSLVCLGEMILERKKEIAQDVHRERMNAVEMTEAEKREFKHIEQNILEIRANFIGLFGEALVDHSTPEQSYEKITQWGKDTGEHIFKLGASLDEALKDTTFYREHIWKAIQQEAEKQNMSAKTIFEVQNIIDPLLDRAVYCFSLTYVDSYQRSLENAKTALLELSVPVVPLLKGVGVLPLIGNVDTERARFLMEETLSHAVKLKLTHLIFDVSGVMIIDTMVADQLFKIIDALALIGVETIMTGIRPEVAHTMVSLGLNLKGVTVKANLHQAFKEIQSLQKA